MKSFAIVIIGYNRLEGIKRLINCLEKADYGGRNDIHLVFSIDNSGSNIVEEFANKYCWPYGDKHVRMFPQRQGLKEHILSCGDFTAQFDIVALFEDDIFVSDSFYHYSYQAAEYYWDDDRIAGISLYCFQKNWLDWVMRFEPQRTAYDNYFLKIAQSWGQVWTADKWNKFKVWYENNKDFVKTEKIPNYLNLWPESSWLKYHDRYCIETDRYFVYPYISLSTNFADVGEHSLLTVNDHQVELQYRKKNYYFSPNNEEAVRYDEYMNRLGIGKYLGIDEDDLTVDFWATKDKTLYKRYVLSCEVLNYKEVKSYSLSIHPIELSVILDLKGLGIWLYDTTEHCKRKRVNTRFDLMLYSIRSHDIRSLIPFVIRLCSKEFTRMLVKLKNHFFRCFVFF